MIERFLRFVLGKSRKEIRTDEPRELPVEFFSTLQVRQPAESEPLEHSPWVLVPLHRAQRAVRRSKEVNLAAKLITSNQRGHPPIHQQLVRPTSSASASRIRFESSLNCAIFLVASALNRNLRRLICQSIRRGDICGATVNIADR